MKYLSLPAVVFLIFIVFLSQRSESAESFDERRDQQQQEKQQQDQQQQELESSEATSGPDSSSGGQGTDRFRTGNRVRYSEEGGTGRFSDLKPTRVSITTEDGNIVITGSDDDWPESGYTWDITDPMEPSLQGFKVTDDHFEPLHGSPNSVDEYSVTWDENGDVVLSNSESSITLSRTGDDVEAQIEGSDGSVEARTNDGEGSINLDGGIEAEGEDVGPVFGTDPSEPFAPLGQDSRAWAWIGLGVALTMFTGGAFLVFKDGLGLVLVDVEDRELDLTRAQVVPSATPDQRVLNLFDELRRDPDGERVIRYLYELVGEGKWGLPPICIHETPNEFLCRASKNLDPESAMLLAGLTEQYSAVRFAPELVTMSDRDRAIDSAQNLYGRLHGSKQHLAGV